VACVVVAVTLLGVGCGADRVTDPARATNCVELVDAGRATAEKVLERLGEWTLADLEGEDPYQPFSGLDPLLEPEVFASRSIELGCGPGELATLACTAYQGISHLARSDVARSYLAPYFAACD
jgi:hypothetical protein